MAIKELISNGQRWNPDRHAYEPLEPTSRGDWLDLVAPEIESITPPDDPVAWDPDNHHYTQVLGVDASGNVTIAGSSVTFTGAIDKIIPGITSISHRNNADTADNLLISNAGIITIRNALNTVAATGITPYSYTIGAGGQWAFGANIAADADDSYSIYSATLGYQPIRLTRFGEVYLRGDVTITNGGFLDVAGTSRLRGNVSADARLIVGGSDPGAGALVVAANGTSTYHQSITAAGVFQSTEGFKIVYSGAGGTVTSLRSIYNSAVAELNLELQNGGIVALKATPTGVQLGATTPLYAPSANSGAAQLVSALWQGTGAPNNANGANGDLYLRGDGAAGTMLYKKAAGTWAAVI